MSKISTLLKSSIPSYSIKLPISGKQVKYRPFLVKEEKVLLLALEEDTEEAILQAIVNIVEECSEDLDNGSDLPLTDLEYLFLNIRAKAVGDIVSPNITCPTTGEPIEQKIDISKIKPKTPKVDSNKIQLNETVGITMKYPTIKILTEKNLSTTENLNTNDTFRLISSCIEEIWTDEDIYSGEQLKENDVLQFVETMTTDQFDKINDFFSNIPKLSYTIKYKTKDGEERKLELTTLSDFFV